MHRLLLTLTLAALPGAAAPIFNFLIATPAQTALPGSVATFDYNIENQSTNNETLFFQNLAFSSGFAGFGTVTTLIDPLLTVAPGTTALGSLFQIALDPAVLPGSSIAALAQLTVEFDDADFTVDTQAQTFSLTAGSAIPEPGTQALFLGAGVSLLILSRIKLPV